MIPKIPLKLYLPLQIQEDSLTFNVFFLGCTLKFLPQMVNVDVFHVEWPVRSMFGGILLLPVPILFMMFAPLKFPGLNMCIGLVMHA